MNTYVFDATGRCICAANYEVDGGDAPAVVHSDVNYAPEDIYYDFTTGEIAATGEFDVTVSTNTVTGLPVGTTVYFGQGEEVVDDGEITLSVSLPDTVSLLLSHPAYHNQIVQVPCEAEN